MPDTLFCRRRPEGRRLAIAAATLLLYIASASRDASALQIGWRARESTDFCSGSKHINVPGTWDSYDWLFGKQTAGYTCLESGSGHVEYVHLEAIPETHVSSSCEASNTCSGMLNGTLPAVFEKLALYAPAGRLFTVSLPEKGKGGYTYLSWDAEFTALKPSGWCSDEVKPSISVSLSEWTSPSGVLAPALDVAASSARFYVIQGLVIASVRIALKPFQGDAAFRSLDVRLDWAGVGSLPECLIGDRAFTWRWGAAVNSDAVAVHAIKAHTELKWPLSISKEETPVFSVSGLGTYYPPPPTPPSPPSPPPKKFYKKYLPTGSSLTFNEAISVGVSLGCMGLVCFGCGIFYMHERRKRRKMEEEFMETMRFNPESFGALFMYDRNPQLEYHPDRDSKEGVQLTLQGPGDSADPEVGEGGAFKELAGDVVVSTRAVGAARHLQEETAAARERRAQLEYD